MNYRTMDYLEVHPNAWGALFDHSSDLKNVNALQQEADVLCQRLAQLSEYLSQRGAAGCGDQKHEEALKQSQAKLKTIRKALGYTYP